jgi:hypothetical protein
VGPPLLPGLVGDGAQEEWEWIGGDVAYMTHRPLLGHDDGVSKLLEFLQVGGAYLLGPFDFDREYGMLAQHQEVASGEDALTKGLVRFVKEILSAIFMNNNSMTCSISKFVQ